VSGCFKNIFLTATLPGTARQGRCVAVLVRGEGRKEKNLELLLKNLRVLRAFAVKRFFQQPQIYYTKNPTPIARGPAWTMMAGGNS